MELVLIIVGALVAGILGGWIYAGFPLVRRGKSPASTARPAHVIQATDA
jgi:heme A synthase